MEAAIMGYIGFGGLGFGSAHTTVDTKNRACLYWPLVS